MYQVCCCAPTSKTSHPNCPVHGDPVPHMIAYSACEECTKLKNALREIADIAKEGRDWNLGHFCNSRSKMQSIVDRCTNALRD